MLYDARYANATRRPLWLTELGFRSVPPLAAPPPRAAGGSRGWGGANVAPLSPPPPPPPAAYDFVARTADLTGGLDPSGFWSSEVAFVALERWYDAGESVEP